MFDQLRVHGASPLLFQNSGYLTFVIFFDTIFSGLDTQPAGTGNHTNGRRKGTGTLMDAYLFDLGNVIAGFDHMIFCRRLSGEGSPLSPEEICSITGFSRSSVSVIISQLEVIGIVDGLIDSSQTGRGRRRTLYSISGGLSSLTLFGIKRISVELH